MLSTNAMKQFVAAVYEAGEKSGWPVNALAVWKEHFSETAALESSRKIAEECHNHKYLVRSIDGTISKITPAGLELIGKG